MPTIEMKSEASAWKGRITWSVSQDITNNTSTVYASVSTWKTDNYPSSSSSGAPFKGTLYIGDDEIDFSFQQQDVASESNPQWQTELETTIYHNDDGTGSVYIYCQIDAPSGISMYNKPLKGGGTYSLTTIPRASSISSSGKSYFGNTCSIKWRPMSSSYYYKLKFSIGAWSFTTDPIKPGVTTDYVYSGFTIPIEVANQIPNDVSGKMYVSLYTYSDKTCSTQIGATATSTFTVALKEDVIPEITSISISLNNQSSAVNEWGVALAGYTGVNIIAEATGVYGSKISSFSISGDYSAMLAGESLNYAGTIIHTSGNKQFYITCTDSRGRTSNIEQTDIIQFLPYTKPVVKSLSSIKEEYGDNDISNDRMVITATWEYDTVNGYNSANGVVYYKESSASDWMPHQGVVINEEPFVLTDLVLDDTKSYNIKIVVTDAVGNSSDKSSFSSTTTVLLDFKAGGDGLGVGKICESPGMEVSMNATFYNDLFLLRDASKYSLEEYIKLLAQNTINDNKKSIINSVYPIGSIYISMSDSSPFDLFGIGEWERLKDRFLIGAGTEDDKYLVGNTGGSETVTLTIDQMPSHKHWGVTRPSYDAKAGTHPSPIMDDNNINFLETNSEGGGQPHNNMPPYLAVYMWKRVA